MSLRIAVFASGGGSNLQALLDHFAEGTAAGEYGRVVLVVSDRVGAGALERARVAGVEGRVIPVNGRGVEEVGAEMLGVLRGGGIDLVVLAGYLRLMPAEVVREYRGRMLNIHPSLLPAFGGRGMFGMHIHRAVLEAGCRVSGATVHFVDERYDTGPILVQWPVPVLPGDGAEELAVRVLGVEHRILPLAVEFVARGLVRGADGSDRSEWEGARSSSFVFGLREEEAPSEDEVRRVLGHG